MENYVDEGLQTGIGKLLVPNQITDRIVFLKQRVQIQWQPGFFEFGLYVRYGIIRPDVFHQAKAFDDKHQHLADLVYFPYQIIFHNAC